MRTLTTSKRPVLWTTLFALVLVTPPTTAQVMYEPVELGTLGGTDSEAYKINDYGQIVGRALDADGTPRVFHWQNGEMLALLLEARWGRNTLPTAEYSVAYGISNTDHVISTVLTPLETDPTLLCESAILFRPGVMTDLSTPYPGEAIAILAAHDSSATDISADGLYVVGWSSADSARFPALPVTDVFAFLVTPVNGAWADPAVSHCGPQNTFLKNLGTLRARDENSSATAVNNLGQVVGWSYTWYPGDQTHAEKRGYAAFLITPDDTDADGIPDYWGELPDGASDSTNAQMIELGTLGGHNSWARAINDAGLIVGEADTGAWQTHAFLWEGGTITDLGTLGGNSSSAAAIGEIVTDPASGVESGGQVVGWALDAAGEKRAFVVAPKDSDGDGKLDQWFVDANQDGINDLMTDLNGLLPAGFKVRLNEARDINSLGQIVGWGAIGTKADAPRMAYLLTPTAATAPAGDGASSGNDAHRDAVLVPVEPEPQPASGSGAPAGQPQQTAERVPPLSVMHFLCGTGLVSAVPFLLVGVWCAKLRLRRARR